MEDQQVLETPVASPEAAPKQETPLEVQAAMFLQGALPAFRQQLTKVTGVQGKRVLEAIIESPLEQNVPGFTTQEAYNLFELGVKIQSAKFILFQVALKDENIEAEVQKKAVEEAQTQESSKEEV